MYYNCTMSDLPVWPPTLENNCFQDHFVNGIPKITQKRLYKGSLA